MTGDGSAAERLRATIMADRDRIARGERPSYHVTWAPAVDAVDVRIVELPLVHLFVPDQAGVPDGARALIARTLDVPPTTFDVVVRPVRTLPAPGRRSRGR